MIVRHPDRTGEFIITENCTGDDDEMLNSSSAGESNSGDIGMDTIAYDDTKWPGPTIGTGINHSPVAGMTSSSRRQESFKG